MHMHMHSNAGFTLVEVVTTLVLIGILTAVAVPRFVDSDNAFSQRGYADEIASTLRYARNVAIATECQVRVTVNAGDYIVHQPQALNACASPAPAWTTPVRRGDGTPLAGRAPASVHTTAPVMVVFNSKGIAAAPADIVIGPFTIYVDMASGLISVQS